MPPKVKDLVRKLNKAGFENRGGKGSHRNFEHVISGSRITISGQLGDDAKKYQVKEVEQKILESQHE